MLRQRRLIAALFAVALLGAAAPAASLAGPVKPLCGTGSGPGCPG